MTKAADVKVPVDWPPPERSSPDHAADDGNLNACLQITAQDAEVPPIHRLDDNGISDGRCAHAGP
jgi:hypothetical protein